MPWNEQDHPRDDEGKFTFKNGGKASESKNVLERAAETLYRDERLQRAIEAKELKTKNELLDILGPYKTQADVIYGSEKSLKGKIAEHNLGYKLREQELENMPNKSAKQVAAEFGIGSAYEKVGYDYANSKYGPDTMGMLNLSHKDGKKSDYIKDAIELKNYKDPRIASDSIYLRNKLKEQYIDYGFKTEEVKGYFFKTNSQPSIRMSQDKDFIKMIKNNEHNLKNGIEFSGYFPCYKDGKESNWHYALGHYDVRNSYIDKKGNLRLKVYDTYDFNKKNLTAMNQAGRAKMLDGTLQPYFTIHDIIIPKSVLDEIWNNKK